MVGDEVGDTANIELNLYHCAYISEKRQHMIPGYLNKEESKVIFMREFEISLFQTQCIGSPKRRVECTNNASKYQFALSSPHSFVICRAPQALN